MCSFFNFIEAFDSSEIKSTNHLAAPASIPAPGSHPIAPDARSYPQRYLRLRRGRWSPRSKAQGDIIIRNRSDGTHGLPVNMRLRIKDGPTHIDLAESMLTEVARWLPNRRFICHCNGFCTALIDRDLPQTHLITHMRKDAIIFELPPKEKPRRGRKRIRGRPQTSCAQVQEGLQREWMIQQLGHQTPAQARRNACRSPKKVA